MAKDKAAKAVGVPDGIDQESCRKRLEERLAVIDAARKARRQESQPVELDQARLGRLSRMDALQQQAMSQAAARLEELERQRILAALDRIKTGEYGYCVICGEEIAGGRLRFDPSVAACITCARRVVAD
ncbi:MAG: TraR/DksA family transcriptional regulator [Desulfobulbaceae bacterium]